MKIYRNKIMLLIHLINSGLFSWQLKNKNKFVQNRNLNRQEKIDLFVHRVYDTLSLYATTVVYVVLAKCIS